MRPIIQAIVRNGGKKMDEWLEEKIILELEDYEDTKDFQVQTAVEEIEEKIIPEYLENDKQFDALISDYIDDNFNRLWY